MHPPFDLFFAFCGDLGDDDGGENQHGAGHLAGCHNLMEDEPSGQAAENGFEAHNQGRGGGFQIFLGQDLQGIGDTHGQDTGEAQALPVVEDCGQGRGFGYHEGCGNQTAHQRLDDVQTDAVQLVCHPIHQRNLHGKGKGTANHQNITDVDGGYACAAEQIQADDRNSDGNDGGQGRLFTQHQTAHGHQHDVHGGNETGFAGIGVHQSHLLGGAGHKQGQAAQDTGLPKLFVGPFFQEGLPLRTVKQKDHRDQDSHRQETANGLEAEGTDDITHGLGHKGRTPDHRRDQQQKHGFDFLSIHIITVPDYTTTLWKMQGRQT